MAEGLVVQIRPAGPLPRDCIQRLCQGPWTLIGNDPAKLTLFAPGPEDAWDEALSFLQDTVNALEEPLGGLLAGARWEAMPASRYRDINAEVPKRAGNSWWILAPRAARITLPAGGNGQGRRTIFMEPGWAFGDGCHPTTQGCIHALEYLEERGLVQGRRALDVGTGTGILGIIAAKMSAEAVLCLDVDKEALEVARGNVQLNSLEERVLVSDTPLSRLPAGHWHLVLANLTVSVMARLFAEILARLHEGGHLVLSGFGPNQACMFLNGRQDTNPTLLWSMEEDGWTTMVLRFDP